MQSKVWRLGLDLKIVEIPGHEFSDEMRKGTNGPSFCLITLVVF